MEKISPLGAELRVALDGSFADRRAAVREVFPSERMHRDPTISMDEARQYTLERLGVLARAGVAAKGFPRGADDPADPIDVLVAFEALAYGDLSVSIKSGVQLGLFGGAVVNLGTARHHDAYLNDIADLKLLGVYAMTEIGHGSDVSSLETTITWDGATGEFIVHSPTPSATKTYLGNAALHGTMAVVYGQLQVGEEQHGVHCILVPIRDAKGRDLPGVTTGDNGHKGGLVGIDNGTLTFDHVRVPRTNLLDRYGSVDEDGTYASPIENRNKRFFTMLGTLVRGRVCISAGAGLAARRGLSIATRYALKRRQFEAPGRPEGVLLLDYLTHQRRLLPGIATAYALGFAQNALNETLVAINTGAVSGEREQRELESFAAGLKAVTTRFANDVLQTCREACGGAGYMSANGLTLLRQDTDVFATFEGDNTVLLQLVAKGLLGNYREAWGQLDNVGTAVATARLVGRAVYERTPARSVIDRLVATARRTPDQVSVLNRGWQLWMFSERAEHILDSLVQRMRAAKNNAASNGTVNPFGDHMIAAARAHMDRVILESFVAGIEATQDPVAKSVLNQVCDLYALSVLDADRGWFLEHNMMSPVRAKALVVAVNQRCSDLRPRATALVEGLGIPESWLNSEMLRDA